MAIPEHSLSPHDFLVQLRSGSVAIDVRSPGEFEAGHLPGAVSLPLFSNDERAEVGTLYKHEGKRAALERGLELVGPKMKSLVTQARALFESQASRKPLLVHCWRGGMRSESVDWLLRTAEIPSSICVGGYKACRQVMRLAAAKPRNYVVLGGMTGSAKTEVLHELRDQGQAVLDLEGLAKHFGSAFGNLDNHDQPSTEQFANDLATELTSLDEQFGEGAVIWLEDESRQIGRVHVPEGFHKRLRDAPLLELTRSMDDRLEHLVGMYGESSKVSLSRAFDRIADKLGGQHAQAAKAHLAKGELREAARIALVYYDKAYPHGREPREELKRLKAHGMSPEEMAGICINTMETWRPWKTSN